jgi:hypothetical protein
MPFGILNKLDDTVSFFLFLISKQMGVLSTLRNFFTRRETNKRLSDTPASEKASSDRKASVTTSKISSVHTQQSLMKDSTNSITKNVVTSPSGSTKHSSSSGNGYSFQYRDGRRYHDNAEVAYVLPNDDDGTLSCLYYLFEQISHYLLYSIEADRVHEQHWILRHALGG